MNPLSRLIAPRLPPAAVGLSAEGIGLVQLDRRRDSYAVRRAGYLPLREGLVRPHFDEPNLSAPAELAAALSELADSAGLAKRRRWSAALPEAATRTSILTIETAPASRHEAEEMLRWKSERALGATLDELRISRERLPPDAQGRARHLITAVRLPVLEEYESVFASLGWHVGLILPRHMGEAWWLMKEGEGAGPRAGRDALLVSGHSDGFTAVILRAGQPLYVRAVSCEPEDRADELYRFLLFYRDRHAAPAGEGGEVMLTDSIGRLLVAGAGLDASEAAAIVEETLAAPPRAVRAADVRLLFPASEIDFEQIAAPAGLAALAWA